MQPPPTPPPPPNRTGRVQKPPVRRPPLLLCLRLRLRVHVQVKQTKHHRLHNLDSRKIRRRLCAQGCEQSDRVTYHLSVRVWVSSFAAAVAAMGCGRWCRGRTRSCCILNPPSRTQATMLTGRLFFDFFAFLFFLLSFFLDRSFDFPASCFSASFQYIDPSH